VADRSPGGKVGRNMMGSACFGNDGVEMGLTGSRYFAS
jgi:hypothetical protein